jgi:hypothetical protein
MKIKGIKAGAYFVKLVETFLQMSLGGGLLQD